MPDKVKRNFDNYATRRDALLAFENLPQKPIWFSDYDPKAYFAVDFDEWLWLPENMEWACPLD